MDFVRIVYNKFSGTFYKVFVKFLNYLYKVA